MNDYIGLIAVLVSLVMAMTALVVAIQARRVNHNNNKTR